jgi:hypothetical protein
MEREGIGESVRAKVAAMVEMRTILVEIWVDVGVGEVG